MTNNERLACCFLDEAISQANEIIRYLTFCKTHLSLLEHPENVVPGHIDEFSETIQFKIKKAQEWIQVKK